MNYKQLLESVYEHDKHVPTITFNFKNDGRDGLGFRRIDELTDDYVVLSDSISTFRLYFDRMDSGKTEVSNATFTVLYYHEYPNHRFIIVNKPEDKKYLIELLGEDKSDELLMINLF